MHNTGESRIQFQLIPILSLQLGVNKPAASNKQIDISQLPDYQWNRGASCNHYNISHFSPKWTPACVTSRSSLFKTLSTFAVRFISRFSEGKYFGCLLIALFRFYQGRTSRTAPANFLNDTDMDAL